MRFIHHEHVERIVFLVEERARPAKECVHFRPAALPPQLFGINRTWGGVLGNILHELPPARQFGQKVHGHHRLARARATFDKDHLLRACLRLVRQGKDGLVSDFLLVHKHELRLVGQHPGYSVGQLAGGAHPSVLYLVEQRGLVTPVDMPADELAQLLLFVLAAQEQWRLLEVFGIPGVVDHPLAPVIVQVGAGTQPDVAVVDGLVEAFQQRGIGPGLVARMRALAFAGTASLRPDDTVLFADTRVRPLLQFHDHQVRRVVLVATGQQHIDALRALWDLVLDAHAHVVRQPRGAQHLGHLTQ